MRPDPSSDAQPYSNTRAHEPRPAPNFRSRFILILSILIDASTAAPTKATAVNLTNCIVVGMGESEDGVRE